MASLASLSPAPLYVTQCKSNYTTKLVNHPIRHKGVMCTKIHGHKTHSSIAMKPHHCVCECAGRIMWNAPLVGHVSSNVDHSLNCYGICVPHLTCHVSYTISLHVYRVDRRIDGWRKRTLSIEKCILVHVKVYTTPDVP